MLISTEFPPGPGGIGNHAHNLAKYIDLNGKEIKVLTVSDYAEEKDIKDFDKQQKIEITRFERYESRVKTYLERIKLIKKELRRGNYSHIIFSGRFSLFCCALLSKEKYKAKYISIVHGGDINVSDRLQISFINKALEKSDMIIPVSNYTKSFIKAKILPENITVIPNGFDLENIENIKVSEKFSVNGIPKLVSVGSVWPRKGHHNVLNALPKLRELYPELKYTIIGRHTDLSQVKKFFEDEQFMKNVNVAGQVSDQEKINLLSESDIFILLSELQTGGSIEGFGIAVIEANYFGLPAIGSKNSGLEDAINNGVSGILVDPKNPEEIQNAVKTISDNYSEFSKNAREWAKEHHWSKIIKRYIRAIDSK